jgi:hypothetical protein
MKPLAYEISDALNRLLRANKDVNHLDMFNHSESEVQEKNDELEEAFQEFAELIRSSTRE